MKKSKFLILGSIVSLGSIPFVAAKCGNENQNSIKEDKTDSQSKSEKNSGTVKKESASENSTIDKKENESAPMKQSESENSKSEKSGLGSKKPQDVPSISDSVNNMNTEMPKVTESVANETDDGESISDILDDEAKKYFKKEIDAEYENIEKMINKVLKSDSDKKSKVLEYFKKLKTLLNSMFDNAKTFEDIDKIFDYLGKVVIVGKTK
ncbi:variable surface lipoprotein [Mycoplasma bovis]|uniref:variable surface lipoprotein n=1 Tax=Mycoplasmopsis bovis TaxID=28903 RepID=UPI001BDF3540|nr:variable surface lipoprotein [Mycoplasmopsis bovis]MBT1345297.1 variable surface lipoprotein [Mycoplasmopsis bovis]MBT1386956.1 variable surface lipoprotein [Mycoplasmopsis bovis]MBT1419015.1 variable surface lipoprotein [Mycoplasmopsis bovis]MBT1419774.1 variable surface lipoprotein [Mycoplasmopsis bovis]UJB25219.1 variable surface lipoprotein [Mycoplasmopsis bovis]